MAAGKERWEDGKTAQEIQMHGVGAAWYVLDKVAEELLAVHLSQLVHLLVNILLTHTLMQASW